MRDRSANVSRLAPLDTANSSKARTAPAATVSSRMAQAHLVRAVMSLMPGVIPIRFAPRYPWTGFYPTQEATMREIGERSLIATARLAGALNVLSAVPDGFSVTVMRKL